MLTLNNGRVNAFCKVATEKSFKNAALSLCITQPALSQRIQKLEQELQSTLFIRSKKGVELTSMGKKLFRYARNNISLEQELLAEFLGHQSGIFGSLRIAAYSSVMRSVIMPALKPLIASYPLIQVEFYSREIRELLPMLNSGEVDLIVLNYDDGDVQLEKKCLGRERLVHICPADQKLTEDWSQRVFLDHDSEDSTTYDFFAQQGSEYIALQRRFYDDIYGIIDGVSLGLGEAIVSHHLVANNSKITHVHHPVKVEQEVNLCWKKSAHISRLQSDAIDMLSRQASLLLRNL